MLLELGLSVCSIEPDEKMLYQLLASAARATGVVGRVEALPLSDNSIDTVTVGQAWHWFEPATAAREFTRVVRPGGVIGLLWNLRDDSEPWMAQLRAIVGGEDWEQRTAEDSLSSIAAVLPGVELNRFDHAVAMSPEAVVNLVGTFSFVRLREDAERIYAAVAELLRTHPDTRDRTVIEVPYVTVVYRTLCP